MSVSQALHIIEGWISEHLEIASNLHRGAQKLPRISDFLEILSEYINSEMWSTIFIHLGCHFQIMSRYLNSEMSSTKAWGGILDNFAITCRYINSEIWCTTCLWISWREKVHNIYEFDCEKRCAMLISLELRKGAQCLWIWLWKKMRNVD